MLYVQPIFDRTKNSKNIEKEKKKQTLDNIERIASSSVSLLWKSTMHTISCVSTNDKYPVHKERGKTGVLIDDI